MSKLQILCTTMHQNDFSKLKEMNIHCDVVFANQTDVNDYSEITFESHFAKMISTNTIGVGINRNISLAYAEGEICLFADDDMRYEDNVEEIILREFRTNPDADIIIFNVKTLENETRKQKVYENTHRCSRFERMPWGAVRIAFRLSSIKKANLWFTTLFGGGAIYASGEDSIWLKEAKRKGLRFYVSKEYIGTVSFDRSTWYTGRDEKLFFARGAYIKQVYKNSFSFWMFYYALRLSANSKLSFSGRIKWIRCGGKAFDKLLSFEEFIGVGKNEEI